jgi:hypothetical protein
MVSVFSDRLILQRMDLFARVKSFSLPGFAATFHESHKSIERNYKIERIKSPQIFCIASCRRSKAPGIVVRTYRQTYLPPSRSGL